MREGWCPAERHASILALNPGHIRESWKILQFNGHTIWHGQEILEIASRSHP